MLPGLIEAGIDCIEHGTGLTEDLIEAMVEHGTRLVPTVMQLDKFPEHAAAGQERFPTYAATMSDLYDRMPATIMAAEAGVPIYAGSDGGGISRHGNIAGEIEALARIGMPAFDALGAARLAGSRVAGRRRAHRRRVRRLRGLRPRPGRRPVRAAHTRRDRAPGKASGRQPMSMTSTLASGS